MSLTRRVQLLLDDERYQRVAAQAHARKASVNQVIREAIDRAYGDPVLERRRRAAARVILSAAPMPVPDPEELKRELDELRSGGS